MQLLGELVAVLDITEEQAHARILDRLRRRGQCALIVGVACDRSCLLGNPALKQGATNRGAHTACKDEPIG